MPTTLPPPVERRADDIVDAYLAETFGIGLEQVLLDVVEGRPTPALAGSLEAESTLASRWPERDGGLTESFEGVITLQGVRYSFCCSTYSIPIAYVHRFLVNVARFEPLDWSVSAAIGERA